MVELSRFAAGGFGLGCMLLFLRLFFRFLAPAEMKINFLSISEFQQLVELKDYRLIGRGKPR